MPSLFKNQADARSRKQAEVLSQLVEGVDFAENLVAKGVDPVNAKLLFLEYSLFSVETKRFSQVWHEQCRAAQRQLFCDLQFFSVDASLGMRAVLKREDLTAVPAGEQGVYFVSNCEHVNVSYVHWDREYKGRCFEYFPAELELENRGINASVMFLMPGSRELFATSREIPCPAPVGVFRGTDEKFYNPTGQVHVSHAAVEILWRAFPNYTLPSFSSGPLFLQTQVVQTAYTLAQLRESVARHHELSRTINRLINYTAERSADPNMTRAILEGIGEGSGAFFEGIGKGIGHVFAGGGEGVKNAADDVGHLLKGATQLILNLLGIAFALLLLAAGVYIFVMWLRKRKSRAAERQTGQPPDKPDDSESELQEVVSPMLPRAENKVFQSQQRRFDPHEFARSIAHYMRNAPPLYPQLPAPPRSELKRSWLTTLLRRLLSIVFSTFFSMLKEPSVVALVGTATWKNPIIPITLQGEAQRAIIDTGASVNLIQLELLQRVQQRMPCVRLEPSMHAPTNIQGNAFDTCGTTWLTVETGQERERVPFVVVKQLSYPVILGTNYLYRFNNMAFNWRKGFCVIGKDRIKMEGCFHSPKDDRGFVRLVKSTWVPARQQAFVEATVIGPYAKLPFALFEPSPTLQAKSVYGASSVSSIVEGKLRVLILNPTNRPVKLYHGTGLGKVSLFSERISETAFNVTMSTDASKSQATSTSQSFCDEVTSYLAKTSAHLTGEERKKAEKLLIAYEDIFSHHAHDVGSTNVVEHSIPLVPGTQPIHQRPYRTTYHEREEMEKHVEAMLEADIVEPSTSPWSSPAILVSKKDGQTRFVVDFRRVNAVTLKSSYPIPHLDDIFISLGRGVYFTSLDQRWGFFQIGIKAEDREKTAFSTLSGHWQFKKMAFGLCGSPLSFQKAIDIILSGLS